MPASATALAMLLLAVVGATPNELLRSGTEHLRAGRIDEANEDFDRLLEADPPSKPYLWQRGISLYLAGEYAKGEEQFESHRAVNPHDVENATWHFLCVAATRGVEEARKSMLPAPGDPRVPMEQLYALYRGTGDRAAVEAAVERLPKDSPARRSARFYADLYLGLLAHAEGQQEQARDFLKAAAATPDKNVMTDVARVCFKRLASEDRGTGSREI